MRGDLSETSVADLFRGLSDTEATGAVELDGADGDARVYFRRGQVYWAMSPAPRARLGDRLVNGGLLDQAQLDEALADQTSSPERTKLGEILVERELVTRDAIRVFVQEQILDAVFDLMRWREGSYVFRPGEAADEKLPVDIPVDQLLVEVSRRQSEWDQIQVVIWDLDMVPDFVTGASSAHAALEPDEFAVLASVDGHRSIRELADDLGYSEFEAARIVYGLTLLGIVDVRVRDDEASDAAEGEPEGDADRFDFDLDDLAVDPAAVEEAVALAVDEGLDVASALEEALADGATAPGSPAQDTPRPRIRVHVADDLSDYVPARVVTDRGLERPESEASDDATSTPDAPVGVPPTAKDEPQPWVQTEEGPEPTTTEPDEEAGPAPEEPDDVVVAGTERSDADEVVSPTEPAELEEPGGDDSDLDDADFDALISQLAEPPGPSSDAVPPAPEPPAEPSEPVDRSHEAGDEPPDAGGPPSEGSSDVSEFLRELSRLTVDEGEGQDAGERADAPRRRAVTADDAASDAAAEARQRDREREREREARAEADKREGGDKKRGLFGWGR